MNTGTTLPRVRAHRAGMTLILTLIALSTATAAVAQPAGEKLLALRGVTVTDVADGGTSANDIEDAVVVIGGDRILAVGPASSTPVPAGAETLEFDGSYLVPGLIDVFAALNHQGQANAHLAMGVTTILGVESTRRGPLDLDCDPSPRVMGLGEVGYEPAPLEELLDTVDRERARGADVLLVMYRVEPEQMGPVVARAHSLGMPVIGELARTTYPEAAALGVDAFVHTTRYSLGLAPDSVRRGIDAEPFSDDLDSAKWRYYRMLPELAADREATSAYGDKLAAAGVALIPTLSLNHLDRPGHENPWSSAVGPILDARDIHWPADPVTGDHDHDSATAEAYRAIAEAELQLDAAYFAAGCRYLAGSGADVWGTMPGISLHHELAGLVRIGHTPRQALAAATSNVAVTFGWDDVGGIVPGRRADLVLLGADPREDVRNLRAIRTVLLGGRILNREALLTPAPLENGQLLRRAPMPLSEDLLTADGTPVVELDHLDAVTIDEITYVSDGLQVTGHLIVPRTPGPHPCLVYNRGGNREFGANSPQRVAQRLARFASWGYVVVASQYRGNAGGEGREEFGGAEVADVVNLIPLLESLEEADASRIGVVGFSRGGLMTYLALTRTDRFAAAAIVAGIADSRFGVQERPEMEEFVYAELVPGFADDRDAALSARSPVEWPERLCPKTPVLLLHGTADWRVHPTDSMRMTRALFDLQRPVRLVLYEGADHSLSEVRDEAYGQIRAWLDRYVRDRAPLPDLEPHGG